MSVKFMLAIMDFEMKKCFFLNMSKMPPFTSPSKTRYKTKTCANTKYCRMFYTIFSVPQYLNFISKRFKIEFGNFFFFNKHLKTTNFTKYLILVMVHKKSA